MSDPDIPATADTLQLLLEHHLKQLRLPTFLREYDKLSRQCAAEQADYPHYLLRLSELELLERERRATERRIHQARFPVVKSLETFEFAAIPSLNKSLVLELARCEFIERTRAGAGQLWHRQNSLGTGFGTGGLSERLSRALHHHCRHGA